jgi:predicted RNA-binding Zn ribbon-like protein
MVIGGRRCTILTSSEVRHALGNRLCLDFVNLSLLPGHSPAHTPAWDDLIDFLSAKRILSEDRTEHLRNLPASDVRAAEALMRRALELSNALRHCFRAMLRGQQIAREWIAPINRVLAVTEGHDALEWDGTAWRLGFIAREEGLEWLLAAIARSGAELIVEKPQGKLRQCANPSCQILFYDGSRTQRRRWCSMALCGNRSKVATFARRHAGERARAHHA